MNIQKRSGLREVIDVIRLRVVELGVGGALIGTRSGCNIGILQ